MPKLNAHPNLMPIRMLDQFPLKHSKQTLLGRTKHISCFQSPDLVKFGENLKVFWIFDINLFQRACALKPDSMASLCVECWRSAKRLLSQRLIRVKLDTTLKEVFDSHVKPRLADHGS